MEESLVDAALDDLIPVGFLLDILNVSREGTSLRTVSEGEVSHFPPAVRWSK